MIAIMAYKVCILKDKKHSLFLQLANDHLKLLIHAYHNYHFDTNYYKNLPYYSCYNLNQYMLIIFFALIYIRIISFLFL